MNSGTGLSFRSERVTPPKTSSRRREWTKAPMTIRSARVPAASSRRTWSTLRPAASTTLADAVPGEMGDELLDAHDALVPLARDEDDVGRPRGAQQRHGLGDGARGIGAAVPGDEDAPARERADTRRHDDDGTPAREDGLLDEAAVGTEAVPLGPEDREVLDPRPADDVADEVGKAEMRARHGAGDSALGRGSAPGPGGRFRTLLQARFSSSRKPAANSLIRPVASESATEPAWSVTCAPAYARR